MFQEAFMMTNEQNGTCFNYIGESSTLLQECVKIVLLMLCFTLRFGDFYVGKTN